MMSDHNNRVDHPCSPQIAPEPPRRSRRRSRLAIAAVIAILIALQAAVFPDALLVIDSGRDLANAWVIAQGTHFPATGPSIYGIWSLGPLWFYLLAVPLVLGGSLGMLALGVGLLAATKVLFAYRLGRHLYGPAGGLALAGVIAVPGWNSVSAMTIGHTSLIEAAVLGSLLASYRAWLKPESLRLLLAAAVFSIALHAHPTAVVVAPWLCAAFLRRLQLQRLGAVPVICASVVAALLPWLPMLIAEAAAGWPQLAATQQFAAAGGFISRSASLIQTTTGLLTGWPAFVAQYLVPSLAPFQMVLALAGIAALLLAAIGALTALRRSPRLTIAVVAQLLAATWFVSILRPDMPVYLVLAIFPLAAWALVHGWHAALSTRQLHITALAVCLLAAVLQIGVILERRAVVAAGTLPFPGEAVANVSAPVRDDDWTRFWLATRHLESAAKILCGTSSAVHGELAGALAWGSGVALEKSCQPSQRPTLGGRNAQQHTAGIPAAHADHLGIQGTKTEFGFVLATPSEILFPERGIPLPADPRYAVDAYRALSAGLGMRTIELPVPCEAGQIVTINNLMPALNPAQLQAHRRDVPLVPDLSTIASNYFICHASGTVELKISTLNPDAIDVFLLQHTPSQ